MSKRQQSQIEFISQFTNKIIHISGRDNVVADALSRIETISVATFLTFEQLAKKQQKDEEFKKIRETKSSLKLTRISLGTDGTAVWHAIWGERIRPFVPKTLRHSIFQTFHGSSNPSARNAYVYCK